MYSCDDKENMDAQFRQIFFIKRDETGGSVNLNPAVLTCMKSKLYINDQMLTHQQSIVLQHQDIIKLKSPFKEFKFIDERNNDLSRYSIEVTRQFYIGKELGAGYNGTVRLAHDVKTLEKFAIKTLQRTSNDTDVTKEINIMKIIKHPNLIKLMNFIETPSRVHLLVEYMELGDLLHIIMRSALKRLPEAETKFAIHQITQALQHLHQRNIAHLDLKLDNIFVGLERGEFVYKIGDFGHSDHDLNVFAKRGTLGYASPEVISPTIEIYSGKKRDMWSLGVTIFCCLSCNFPFYDDDTEIFKKLIRSADFNFKGRYWNQITQQAKQLISSLIVVNPDQRLTSQNIFQHDWFNDESLKARVNRFGKF
jgi:serine/threonine protein kinase